MISRERVQIPPWLGAEMTAYDPTAGELRTHYAGFFDPGFGYDAQGRRQGARAVLEVRARDVPFMVEHSPADLQARRSSGCSSRPTSLRGRNRLVVPVPGADA